MKRRLALLVSCMTALGGQAQAAIIGTCTITVVNAGTMTTNSALNGLASSHAGGNAAVVTVEPDSLVCSILNLLDCYGLSAPPPAAFLSAPAGGGDGVTYASTYAVDGGAPPARDDRSNRSRPKCVSAALRSRKRRHWPSWPPRRNWTANAA